MIRYGPETIATCGSRVKTAHVGKLVICLRKHRNAPAHLDFYPVKVLKNDKTIWDIEDTQVGCKTLLREVEEEPVIIFVNDKNEVANIFPVLALESAIRLADGEYDYKLPAGRRLDLKLAVAKMLRLQPKLTPSEMLLKERLDRIRSEATARAASEAKAQRQQEHFARDERRREIRRKISLRPLLNAYNQSGQEVFGLPVISNEWIHLGQGVECIQVETYENGIAGKPLEHFFVYINGSKKERRAVIRVWSQDPTKPKLPKKMGEVYVEKDGEFDIFFCYTREGLKALKAEGLNAGSVRGVWPLNPDGSVTLVSFTSKKAGFREIGNFQPIV